MQGLYFSDVYLTRLQISLLERSSTAKINLILAQGHLYGRRYLSDKAASVS
ncbi:uncharacterized protein G6M90_00g066570 [Metarhizium brunneum]|uniref:Uncharacterized protein n=1 Tax=Metarhizium brunneum TaxID=500148 RepID=A0A7D5Z357_9HYPO|nr:hypothetical protein G6M90_00g066570 [Metarhizium brunneum]